MNTSNSKGKMLEDFYKLRSLLQRIEANEKNDVGNEMRADKRWEMIREGVEVCEKWINSNEPLKTKS